MLSARSDIEVTVEDMTTAISTFQTLIQEALTPAGSTITPAESNTTAITKRSYTAELEEINSIFADIQRLADGSALAGSLARRSSVVDTVRALVDCLGRLISGANRKRSVAEGGDDDLAAALATIHGWADGTISLPSEGGNVSVGGFTAGDALEFVTLLKDVIVAWRAQFEATLGTNTALTERSPQSLELSTHFSDIALDKRGNLGLKMALKLLAAAIDAYADTL